MLILRNIGFHQSLWFYQPLYCCKKTPKRENCYTLGIEVFMYFFQKYPLVTLLAGWLFLPVIASCCKAFPILQPYDIFINWNSLKTLFDLVTLTFDLYLWTWPRYPSTRPTCWILGQYVCPFVQESGNTLTDSLTHTHDVKTITPTADAGCDKDHAADNKIMSTWIVPSC